MTATIPVSCRRAEPFTGSLTFTLAEDVELVRRILTAPTVYGAISDDGCPAVEDFRVTVHPSILYVLVHDQAELLGCFGIYLESSTCVQIHTCLLPFAPLVRGRTMAAANGILEWIWANTTFNRVITRVPEFNRLALRFAQKAGMMLFGVNEMSYLKNGVLHDQFYLGISRPGVSKCQQR